MESEFISWLTSKFPKSPRLFDGIGDDAAVVKWSEEGNNDTNLVVTTDMLMDGVDFIVGDAEAQAIGYKALAVNLSDLAAMAAEPVAMVVSLALPQRDGLQLAKELYEGMRPLAEKYDVALAGGDTNSWDKPLAISITAFGKTTTKGPLRRSGAKPGDRILVTGAFGGSILRRHLAPQPRIHEALQLHSQYELHAGIDVSDGLACDLNHICEQSGCGAVVDLEFVPIHEEAFELVKLPSASKQKNQNLQTPLEHALGDGEDFELILAVPPVIAKEILNDQSLSVKITDVGEFIEQPKLWTRDTEGKLHSLKVTGYQHALS